MVVNAKEVLHALSAALQSNVQPLAAASGSSLQSQWTAGQKEMVLFMWSAWSSVPQGNTVRPLRLGSLVFAAEPNGSAREKALPSGVWMLLSVRVKETPASECHERRFQPWAFAFPMQLRSDRRGLPLQLEQNLTLTSTMGGWVGNEGETQLYVFYPHSERGDSSMGPFLGIPSSHHRFE